MSDRRFVVIRVRPAHPKTWFMGYSDKGRADTTVHYSQACRMTADEARQAVFCLVIDHGGTWSIRPALDGDDDG